MKKFVIILLLFLANFISFSQNWADTWNGMLYRPSGGGGMRVAVIENLTKRDTVGSVFLYEKFTSGKIFLTTNEIIENYPLNYDLEGQAMEIKTESEIKVLEVNRILIFVCKNPATLQNDTFINGTIFRQPSGMYRVLTSGNVNLLESVRIKIIRANYNVAMDVGNKNDEKVKEEKLFVLANGKFAELEKNKHIFPHFGDKKTQVEEFADKNKLKVRKLNDLIKIINFYNQLK